MTLSIIIPVFNVEKYIARCLDSIYALPLNEEQFEVLCIYDTCPDKSEAIIEDYQKKYSNLKLIRQFQNGRQGAARNTGIRLAKGEYCMFVDADDSLPQIDILGHTAYMQEHDLDLLLGKANVVSLDGLISKWGETSDKESAIMTGPEFFVDGYIHNVGFGVVWLGLYKTDLVKRVPPFIENAQYEDTDWTLQCAYNAKRVQFKPFVIYQYHYNPGSSSHNVNAQKLEWRVRLSLRVYNWAQHVTKEKEVVQFAAEDFYLWNLRGLSALWKFDLKERRKFYASFSPEEYAIFKLWPVRYKQMYVLKYPYLSQILLLFASPIYRIAWYIKHALKR